MKKFYITTAIPYVNADPHIGHALEFVQADTIARYHRLLGEDVLLLSGGDENAIKNIQAAEKTGIPIQEFVDKNTQKFRELTNKLNCNFNIWQKGSDQKYHFPSCQKLWNLCQKGDIYKKTYKGLYCVGCEVFYNSEELDKNGECFEHPGRKLEEIEEENWFFRLNKYRLKLLNIIKGKGHKGFSIEIVPQKRKHEVLAFLERGLNDISISRSNKRAENWGVPVPNDPTQRIYVWFDALNIYQSGIGFGWNDEKYDKYWPADVHVIGKGIIRFHAIYWPAFLLSAGLKLPKKIFVHEYFTVNGQKMSKTLGNVIDPFMLIEQYGAESLRYYFLAAFSPFNDGDFSEAKFKEIYNSDLANGLGNLVARVAAMAKNIKFNNQIKKDNISTEVSLAFKLSYEFDRALGIIWGHIKKCDVIINETQLWKLKNKEKILSDLVNRIIQIGIDLQPFLPQTSEKILTQFAGPEIKPVQPLFPRI